MNRWKIPVLTYKENFEFLIGNEWEIDTTLDQFYYHRQHTSKGLLKLK